MEVPKFCVNKHGGGIEAIYNCQTVFSETELRVLLRRTFADEQVIDLIGQMGITVIFRDHPGGPQAGCYVARNQGVQPPIDVFGSQVVSVSCVVINVFPKNAALPSVPFPVKHGVVALENSAILAQNHFDFHKFVLAHEIGHLLHDISFRSHLTLFMSDAQNDERFVKFVEHHNQMSEHYQALKGSENKFLTKYSSELYVEYIAETYAMLYIRGGYLRVNDPTGYRLVRAMIESLRVAPIERATVGMYDYLPKEAYATQAI